MRLRRYKQKASVRPEYKAFLLCNNGQILKLLTFSVECNLIPHRIPSPPGGTAIYRVRGDYELDLDLGTVPIVEAIKAVLLTNGELGGTVFYNYESQIRNCYAQGFIDDELHTMKTRIEFSGWMKDQLSAPQIPHDGLINWFKNVV